MIDREQLIAIMPWAVKRADKWVAPLNSAMAEFEINTTARAAAFLAQIAHESGELVYTKELASGAAYDTGRLAERLGNTPEDDDDGERYKGRGLIQITGTTNYRACGEAFGIDLLAQPELLEQPTLAARSAAWFWKTHGLNELADAGDFLAITKRINGGTNGLADRQHYYARAQAALQA